MIDNILDKIPAHSPLSTRCTKINLINKSNFLSPIQDPAAAKLLAASYLTLNGNCCSSTAWPALGWREEGDVTLEVTVTPTRPHCTSSPATNTTGKHSSNLYCSQERQREEVCVFAVMLLGQSDTVTLSLIRSVLLSSLNLQQ